METNTKKLFNRDFTLVVIGQIISLFGNAILRFALPLYLLNETGSASLFGMVSALSFIPLIVMSLLGGVLADRANKRNIMVILDFMTALLIIAFYLSMDAFPIVPLIVATLMILYSIGGAYHPAVQTSIPFIVPEDKLMSGNGIVTLVNSLSGLIGPAIGGVLFGIWGIAPILLISIICFTVSAIMEMFIRIPHTKQSHSQGVLAIVKGDLKESFLFIKNEKPIFFSIGFFLAVFNLAMSSMLIVGMPILIVNVLRLSGPMLGFAQSAAALGGLVGGVFTSVLGNRLKVSNAHILFIICAISVAFMGIPILLGFSAVLCYWLLTVMSFIIMVVATVFSIQVITMVQQQTPPQLIGKVTSMLMVVAGCAQPIGQALFGVLFDVFHSNSWIVLFCSAAVTFILALYSRKIFSKL